MWDRFKKGVNSIVVATWKPGIADADERGMVDFNFVISEDIGPLHLQLLFFFLRMEPLVLVAKTSCHHHINKIALLQ